MRNFSALSKSKKLIVSLLKQLVVVLCIFIFSLIFSAFGAGGWIVVVAFVFSGIYIVWAELTVESENTIDADKPAFNSSTRLLESRKPWIKIAAESSRFENISEVLKARRADYSGAISKKLSILGCRGIPGNHGGFETFAQRLALSLVERGWAITVYCENYAHPNTYEEIWKGVRLVHIPIPHASAKSKILFDWKSTLHAAEENTLVLTLGYSTAIFSLLYRLKGVPNLINMDGLEWKRQKWSFSQRAWLYLNERLGCWFGDHLIADHPVIADHLATRVPRSKITTIPYGADPVKAADAALIEPYGLLKNEYAIVIARPEPENNILEIVSAFSSRHRGLKLVVLGNYHPGESDYHHQVIAAASDEVIFTGGIYDQPIVEALRTYAQLYIHGHAVGGTNPSLVEAMAASSPILAHDNCFTRWVAGHEARFFSDIRSCSEQLDYLLNNTAALESMGHYSLKRYKEDFSADQELFAYENLLISTLEKYALIESTNQVSTSKSLARTRY